MPGREGSPGLGIVDWSKAESSGHIEEGGGVDLLRSQNRRKVPPTNTARRPNNNAISRKLVRSAELKITK